MNILYEDQIISLLLFFYFNLTFYLLLL